MAKALPPPTYTPKTNPKLETKPSSIPKTKSLITLFKPSPSKAIFFEFSFCLKSHSVSTTAHSPDRHFISPWPQSSVSALHSIVQATLEQSGPLPALTASVGWQHCAGTQSESAEQAFSAGAQEIKNNNIKIILIAKPYFLKL